MTYLTSWPPETQNDILTYPLVSSSLLRIEHAPDELEEGQPGPACAFFVDGGSEIFGFVLARDVQAVAGAVSAGTHYWQVFRKKYKNPVVIEGPEKVKEERKARAPKAAPAPADPMPPCPACGGSDVQHSGELSEYQGATINPPAELLRCNAKACWTRYRRDGEPYEERGTSTYDEMPKRGEAVTVETFNPEIIVDAGESALAILDRMALQVNAIVGKALTAVNVDDLVERAAAVGQITSHKSAKAADAVARDITFGLENVTEVFEPYAKAANGLHKAITGARGILVSRLTAARAGVDKHVIAWSDHVEAERLRIALAEAEAEAEAAHAQAEQMRGNREDDAERMDAEGEHQAAAELRHAPLPMVPTPQAPPRSATVDLGDGSKVKRVWLVDEETPFDVDKLVAFCYANASFRRTLVTLNIAGARQLAEAMGHDDGTTDFPLDSGVTPRFAPKVRRR